MRRINLWAQKADRPMYIFSVSNLRMIWGCFALFLSLFGSTAAATNLSTVVYAGKEFYLPIPAGYCAIPKNDPQGHPYYEIQEQLSDGARWVALIFSNCAEWAKRQRDPSYRIRHIGNFSFIKVKKQAYLFPPFRTRAEYIQSLVAEQIPKDPATGKDWEQSTNEKLRKLILETESPTGLSSLNIGIVHTNMDAVFYGVTATVHYPDENVRVIGIGAVTLLNRAAIVINLSNDYSRDHGVLKLLETQKQNVAALIAANI